MILELELRLVMDFSKRNISAHRLLSIKYDARRMQVTQRKDFSVVECLPTALKKETTNKTLVAKLQFAFPLAPIRAKYGPSECPEESNDSTHNVLRKRFITLISNLNTIFSCKAIL